MVPLGALGCVACGEPATEYEAKGAWLNAANSAAVAAEQSPAERRVCAGDQVCWKCYRSVRETLPLFKDWTPGRAKPAGDGDGGGDGAGARLEGLQQLMKQQHRDIGKASADGRKRLLKDRRDAVREKRNRGDSPSTAAATTAAASTTPMADQGASTPATND